MKANVRQEVLSYVYLVAGCVLLLFAGGKWNILIAAWLCPVFLIRYFRTRQNVLLGSAIALPLLLVASYVFFLGLAVQVDVEFLVLIAASYALYYLIPCLADRLLYRRISSPWLSTLVYPAALVVVQFLLSYLEPLGTTLTTAYSQFSLKPLIQLVSITGVWGPTFLVGWFASIAATLWEEHANLQPVKSLAVAFGAVFAAVMLWGGLQWVFFAPGPGTVKVGSVVVGLPEDNLYYAYLDSPESYQQEHREEYRQKSLQLQDDLFAASEQLMPSGIKILAWASGNAVVFAEDEAGLIQRMQTFARTHDVYFFPSLLVMGDHDGPDRNKVLAIRPDGEIEYVHYKGRNPNAGFYVGDTIQVIDTPYGRIASPICFEMEYHRYIQQVGRQGVDILIVPGDEPSPDSAVVHTEISMFRALENGTSMLRTTLEGLTMGVDYQGRELSRMNYYLTEDNRTLITEMPVKGVRTLYSRWGDWFALGCVALLVFLVVTGLVGPARRPALENALSSDPHPTM